MNTSQFAAAARRDQILLLGDFHGDDTLYRHHTHGHHGHHGHLVHIHDEKEYWLGTVDIHPETALAGVSAFGAAALLGMYIAATQNANGKRKRRRSLDDGHSPSVSSTGLGDLILVGNDYKMNLYTFGSSIFCTHGWRKGLCLHEHMVY